ncbi:MAG: RNA methyltransferase [Treponema sp.]|jgi:TrmH RNA methyltransferase|nr:RNA methyltransferase [Treponema sp.]
MYNKLTDELAVAGFNAARALGEQHPERINRLFLREDRFNHFKKVCRNLAERKRPYKLCDSEELEKISKTAHHQGVVAMIKVPVLEPLSPEDLAAWAAKGSVGIILHSIGNDHNLGAIVRAASFFDTPLVVIAGRDAQAPLSTAAYRVAEGGMEQVSVKTVRNCAAFLRDASRRLVTLGTDARARLRIRDIPALVAARQGDGPRPGIALVLGNEEEGLPQDVKDACAHLVRIPGTGVPDSLNVSQAAALFLHELYEL